MEKVLNLMNQVIEDQTVISFEMVQKGVRSLWAGCLYSVFFDCNKFYIAGDHIELELEITDENVEIIGENFEIKKDDLSVFFNIET